MAFNLADMINKRPVQPVNTENINDTVYRDAFELVPSKENFYSTDPKRLQGLKNSILLFGVMQDILIEEVDGKDRIVSGHCRTMCCRMLVEEGYEEFRKINCKYITVKLKTEEFTENKNGKVDQLVNRLAIIQANRFREKTDWEKMQEALVTEEVIKELRELVELQGTTRNMVQATLGVSGTQLERYHTIQKKLGPELLKNFEDAKINISVARELADLDEIHQEEAVELYQRNGAITLPDAKALKEKQEVTRQITGQLTLTQVMGQNRPPENDTIIDTEVQIARFFESLKKSTTERIERCDKNMTIYMLSIIYNSVRVRNGYLNYQGKTNGIVFNPGSDREELITWRQLAETLIAKYGKKKKNVKMASLPETSKQAEREQIIDTTSESVKNEMPEEENEMSDSDKRQNGSKNCVTGQSGSGVCGAAAYCNKGYNCCSQCDEGCNVRCGWIPEHCQQEAEKLTDKQQEALSLPEMRNNDQRKEWLRNYKEWGIWYTDEHIGVRYYKYDFENGARIVVEEYDPDPIVKSQYWVSNERESYYIHLIGGPEPEEKGGTPKWTRHRIYNKYPNSESELVEFLKAIQKEKK